MSTGDLNKEESEDVQTEDVEEMSENHKEVESVESAIVSQNASQTESTEELVDGRDLKEDPTFQLLENEDEDKEKQPLFIEDEEEVQEIKENEQENVQVEAPDASELIETKSEISEELIDNQELATDKEPEEHSLALSGSFHLLRSLHELDISVFQDEDTSHASALTGRRSAREQSIVSKSENLSDEKNKMSKASRQEYYKICERLEQQYAEEKFINANLTKQLVWYFTKHKLLTALQEEQVFPSVVKEYEQQLDYFQFITDSSSVEQAQITAEIAEIEKNCASKKLEVAANFEHLQNLEYEAGKELLTTENKEVDFKTLERLLKRQKVQLNNLSKVRTDYIKMRNKVNEIQEILDKIDNLGSNFRLIDYEQLKLDNRNLHDRLDEKALEIGRVRKKYENTMQVLAHHREKISALDNNITQLKTSLDNVADDCTDLRQQLNSVKQSRNDFRGATEKLKENCGLLGKSRFLRDMEAAIDDIEYLTKRLEEIKNECSLTTQKIQRLRKSFSSMKYVAMKRKGVKEANSISLSGSEESE